VNHAEQLLQEIWAVQPGELLELVELLTFVDIRDTLSGFSIQVIEVNLDFNGLFWFILFCLRWVKLNLNVFLPSEVTVLSILEPVDSVEL